MSYRSTRLIIGSMVFVFCVFEIIMFDGYETNERRMDDRNLRFFDPDHTTCGMEEEHHDFGVSCLYGTSEEGYYEKGVITTDEDLDPKNHTEINKVLEALVYVAHHTNRVILPKIPIIDEEKYPGSEIYQPWAIVDADYLKKIGARAVEPGFWGRAVGKIGREPRRVNVTLGEYPLSSLASVVEDLNKQNEERVIDEIVFSKNQLLALDSNGVGRMIGDKGGYKDGKWVRKFTCIYEFGTEHKEPITTSIRG